MHVGMGSWGSVGSGGAAVERAVTTEVLACDTFGSTADVAGVHFTLPQRKCINDVRTQKPHDPGHEVRDGLGVAKGTFAPIVGGLEVLLSPYARLRVATVHQKKVRKPQQKRLPDVRSDDDCRRLIATLEKPVYRGCFTLIYAYGLRITEAVTLPSHRGRLEADDASRHRQAKQGTYSPADRIDPPDAPRSLEDPS